MGCGMIIRDYRGTVMFAATKLEKIHVSPTLAEALALRWCLQWILTSDQDGHFTVETDTEVVVNCLQGVSRLSAIENIILDCSDILCKHRNCNVNFIRRSRNVVAHCLVGLARQCGSCSWVGYVPEPAASAVCKDLI
jgi:hypothetical protein